MDECKHVYGIGYFDYEGGQLHESAEPYSGHDDYEPFNFCPRCGERLPEFREGAVK